MPSPTSKRRLHPLITGTIILTLTGVVSRVIGFFYRIYLARLFGEEGMGIYQLLGPVLSLSFAFTSAGYQTAISKTVAEQTACQGKPSFRPLAAGLSISLPLSILCNVLIFFSADPIAAVFLQEPRTASMLKILAFSIPLSAVHSCVNGYFYGVKKTGVPSVTQLTEQLIRVSCVYGLSAWTLSRGYLPSIRIAALGLTLGELASVLVSVFCIFSAYRKSYASLPDRSVLSSPILPCAFRRTYHDLLVCALPLTANRMVLNFLQSIEAVTLPAKLRLYGYDVTTALSVYGVLTGMAMPLIFFPNAVTSSISILLLPLISESYAVGNFRKVKENTLQTIRFCALLGLFCMAVFLFLGKWAGNFLFHSPLAGHFIQTLSFICPFIYLDTTLSSILQGLGCSGRIFLINALGILIRLAFVFFLVPHFGIKGYLWGMLAGQITLALLYLLCLGHVLRSCGASSSV